jgi:hypothetical protein
LKESLPFIISQAFFSPPVEIVIVNYSSTDGLELYLEEVCQTTLPNGSLFTVEQVKNRKYYNSAEARNICVQASRGEYILQLSAEALPTKHALQCIRGIINIDNPVWLCEDTKYKGQYVGRYIVCKREEFIASGGYDERFNLYAPEDKDICLRLHRRGGKFISFSKWYIEEIPTDNKVKLENLDKSGLPGKIWDKREMLHLMQPIFDKNVEDKVLVANEEKDWNTWNLA